MITIFKKGNSSDFIYSDKSISKKEDRKMAYYIILSTLTDEGRKTIKENPKRILEVNKELEKMGIKVKEQFAVLGPYDFVNIVEAADNSAIMKMSVELGARGSIQLLTLAAIPIEDFIKKIK
ncbi:MAG: hypothetical protein H6R42_93 [Nitrospirae bacterium]|jgi:uncharacterized protein with GYD domain|nr:hypothetical protein [Nitrospirota bacterium]MBS1232439.1 hypothetical protein [Nitrospirota bacterium]